MFVLLLSGLLFSVFSVFLYVIVRLRLLGPHLLFFLPFIKHIFHLSPSPNLLKPNLMLSSSLNYRLRLFV